MENKKSSDEVKAKNEIREIDSNALDISEQSPLAQNAGENLSLPNTDPTAKNKSNALANPVIENTLKNPAVLTSKKPVKPPKLEEKPFDDFISNHLIPGIKTSIQESGTSVTDIKLVEGTRPVVGGKCWMIFCEITEQRRFWLCFEKELITSNKTILLAESNTDPSIVESFLIDERKTTLALLISRVLQRLNGQKWLGSN